MVAAPEHLVLDLELQLRLESLVAIGSCSKGQKFLIEVKYKPIVPTGSTFVMVSDLSICKDVLKRSQRTIQEESKLWDANFSHGLPSRSNSHLARLELFVFFFLSLNCLFMLMVLPTFV